jgi:hypothetical protein
VNITYQEGGGLGESSFSFSPFPIQLFTPRCRRAQPASTTRSLSPGWPRMEPASTIR